MKSKKNIKGILIIAVLGIMSLFFINMSFAANTAKVVVETANLREKANSDSRILELLSANDKVEILEKDGDWYKVKAKGITGYLRNDLIKLDNEQEQNQKDQNIVSDESNSPEDEQKVETKSSEQTQVETNEIKLGKQKIGENTKLKIVPTINATDIIEVNKDEEVEITEIINGWVCVETQLAKGWVRQEKIKKEEQVHKEDEQTVEEEQENKDELKEQDNVKEKQANSNTVLKTLFINGASVNLRKEANTSSEVVATLPVNTAVDVYEESNGWSKVKVSGKEGYISSSLLSTTKKESSRSLDNPRKDANVSDSKSDNESKDNSNNVNTKNNEVSKQDSSVVEVAKSYIGKSPYVYGGSTPSGFDCSGFTSYIYKQFGVSLNRTAAGQYSNGTEVDKSELQAGDLVMFGKSGINHVGIYIGNGQMVHAANASRGITTDTINSGYYYNNYVGARRVM